MLFFILACCSGYGQVINVDTIKVPEKAQGNYNTPLFSDSLVSSFVIYVQQEVKHHLHAFHSEHVIVLEGTGTMRLGDKTFPVKKGDVIFIPKNTAHSVKNTGAIPLKVVSIQAPLFDGTDRIMVDK